MDSPKDNASLCDPGFVMGRGDRRIEPSALRGLDGARGSIDGSSARLALISPGLNPSCRTGADGSTEATASASPKPSISAVSRRTFAGEQRERHVIAPA